VAGIGDIKPVVTPVSPAQAPRKVVGRERRENPAQHQRKAPPDEQDKNDNHIDEYA